MSNYTLAAEYVTDTVGLILYLEDRRSGITAERIFDSAEKNNTIIHIPAMTFAEILYLSEKNRIQATLTSVYELIKRRPDSFKEFAMNAEVIKTAERIDDIPELHDRLIAASAKSLNIELITNDLKIQNSVFVKTIW